MYTLWIHTLPEKMLNPPVIISQSHGSSRYSWIGVLHQEEEQLLAMAEDLASKELAPWIRVRHGGTMGNQRTERWPVGCHGDGDECDEFLDQELDGDFWRFLSMD